VWPSSFFDPVDSFLIHFHVFLLIMFFTAAGHAEVDLRADAAAVWGYSIYSGNSINQTGDYTLLTESQYQIGGRIQFSGLNGGYALVALRQNITFRPVTNTQFTIYKDAPADFHSLELQKYVRLQAMDSHFKADLRFFAGGEEKPIVEYQFLKFGMKKVTTLNFGVKFEFPIIRNKALDIFETKNGLFFSVELRHSPNISDRPEDKLDDTKGRIGISYHKMCWIFECSLTAQYGAFTQTTQQFNVSGQEVNYVLRASFVSDNPNIGF